MPTKIKAKGKVKTLSGKYTSFLNKNYEAVYYRFDSETDMIEHFEKMEKSDIRHNKFERSGAKLGERSQA